MVDCPECRMEERIKQLEERSSHNSNEHSKFYDKFNTFGLDNQKHDLEIRSMSGKLDEIVDYVNEQKTKPGQWFEKFGSAIIASIGSMVGTGIIGFIAWSVISNIP